MMRLVGMAVRTVLGVGRECCGRGCVATGPGKNWLLTGGFVITRSIQALQVGPKTIVDYSTEV
jgi:hypothetical protein